MKIVIAPDSFKGSLSAAKVAAALAGGVLQVVPDACIDLCPMADGGEGTVDAMVAATNGRLITTDVFDPLGAPIRARFGLLGAAVRGFGSLPGEVGLCGSLHVASGEGEPAKVAGGAVAVIEMASASGLGLIPTEKRDPLRTTTFGTGQLILAALDAGARKIIVGIGGSGTVDGGCGCAQAMGVVFTDRQNKAIVCGLAGGGLTDIEGIDLSDRDPRLAEVRVRVACDVANPLTGPDGAAMVYGPQKGATPEMVRRLEAGLVHLAGTIRREMAMDIEKVPGAGAAGGLGAGLVAFAGATLESGIEIVAEAVGLAGRLSGAKLCITGEGKLDAQSLSGKAAVGVAQIARQANVPVLCIPGQAEPDLPQAIFHAVRPLVGDGIAVRAAMLQTEPLLRRRAAEAVREFLL
ncbi:MAG: glycerate kinase [Planctomycetota bacterium]|nr:glycerate kinase [Planctomycetota bacterium]